MSVLPAAAPTGLVEASTAGARAPAAVLTSARLAAAQPSTADADCDVGDAIIATGREATTVSVVDTTAAAEYAASPSSSEPPSCSFALGNGTYLEHEEPEDLVLVAEPLLSA